MTTYEVGDIALVPFPFVDLKTKKRRPALILTKVPSHRLPTLLLIAMITSQIDSARLPGDCLVAEWQKSGLLHPSKVRLAKLVTVEEATIIKKLGSLAVEDRTTIGQELAQLFKPWLL